MNDDVSIKDEEWLCFSCSALAPSPELSLKPSLSARPYQSQWLYSYPPAVSLISCKYEIPWSIGINPIPCYCVVWVHDCIE